MSKFELDETAFISAEPADWGEYLAHIDNFPNAQLRRTNADKRRAVEIALKEFPKLSNVEVARICAVSDMTVKRFRDDQPQQSGGSPRIGADGKTRKLPERKSETVSNLEAAPSKGSVAELTEPAAPVAPVAQFELEPSRERAASRACRFDFLAVSPHVSGYTP